MLGVGIIRLLSTMPFESTLTTGMVFLKTLFVESYTRNFRFSTNKHLLPYQRIFKRFR